MANVTRKALETVATACSMTDAERQLIENALADPKKSGDLQKSLTRTATYMTNSDLWSPELAASRKAQLLQAARQITGASAPLAGFVQPATAPQPVPQMPAVPQPQPVQPQAPVVDPDYQAYLNWKQSQQTQQAQPVPQPAPLSPQPKAAGSFRWTLPKDARIDGNIHNGRPTTHYCPISANEYQGALWINLGKSPGLKSGGGPANEVRRLLADDNYRAWALAWIDQAIHEFEQSKQG